MKSVWMGRLQLFTGIVVVIAASVLVAWGLQRYLRTSPRFAVRVVEVTGNQRRGQRDIAKRAGVEVGTNIFTFDESRARALLEADPWIESAQVTRDLPHTVRVVVIEREPVAIVAVKGELFLADGKGHIFKPRDEGDAADLPIVTGIDPELLGRDREAAEQRIQRALELYAELERSKISERYPVQELHLEPDARLTVTIGVEALTLELGPPPYRSKVDKLVRVLGEMRHRKVKAGRIFLDNQAHPERVVVRMSALEK